MSNPITSASSVPDSSYGTPQKTPAPAAQPTDSSTIQDEAAPESADMQLVIEDDAKAGCFVYKTIDRRTGKVIQQFPREEILKLREADSYTAGTVIKASV